MIDKKEFNGELNKIDPKLLIDKSQSKDIQNFFLILGLIFNDLKGLLFFYTNIENTYRKPGPEEISYHAGEYNGLMIQIDKLIISTVGEFFNFIDKNEHVIKQIPFRLLLRKMEPVMSDKWEKLMQKNRGSEVLSKIAQVRSNVTFHYDYSKTQLRKGFIDAFWDNDNKITQHKNAYYSFGNSVELSRMFYADAAVQSYINSILDSNDRRKIHSDIDTMTETIYKLLTVYIKGIK